MHILIEFDKSGAEWVCVAYISGDNRMIEVVRGNISPHVITGSLIAGCTEDLVLLDNQIVGHNTDMLTIRSLREEHIPEIFKECTFLPRTMSIRQAGKKSNHGLNYDMGYSRFSLENEMPQTESKQIVELYRTKAYPGVPLWHEAIRTQLNTNRTLINCFDRKRVFAGPWGKELWQQAYAYLPQSTVGDIIYNAMQGWQRESLGFELLSNVHDSLLLQFEVGSYSEIPYDRIYHFANSKEYMNPILCYNNTDFQIKTDIKIGLNWGEDAMQEITFNTQDELQEKIEANWSRISGEAA